MGSTPVYGFPYMDPDDDLESTPAAMQALAEAVEAALQSEVNTLDNGQYLACKAGAAPNWSGDQVGEFGWDVDGATNKRGGFGSGSTSRLVIPFRAGLYLVTATAVFGDVSGNVFGLQIGTRSSSDTKFALNVVAKQTPYSTGSVQSSYVSAAGLVRIPTNGGDFGIAIQAVQTAGITPGAYPSTDPDLCRLRIHRLSSAVI